MVFAKHVQTAGDALNRLVADALKVGITQAKDMRIRAGRQQAQASRLPAASWASGWTRTPIPWAGKNAPVGAGLAGIDPETAARVGEATAGAVESLIGELQMCVRYYESIFPGRVVDRAIFVGGESRHNPDVPEDRAGAGPAGDAGRSAGAAAQGQHDAERVDVRQPQPGWRLPWAWRWARRRRIRNARRSCQANKRGMP